MTIKGRKFWVGLIREYEGAEKRVLQEDFVRRRRVKLATFQSWLYRLRREREDAEGAKSSRPAQGPALLPVQVVAGPGRLGGAMIEAELPNGVRLRFGAGIDGDAIVGLVARLAG